MSSNKEYEYKGFHATVDILVNNFPDDIVNLVRTALKYSNLTIVTEEIKNFEPQGETGIWVLAESSATLHTYPESNMIYFDVFTCGEEGDPEGAVNKLLSMLDVADHDIKCFKRGYFEEKTISMAEKAFFNTDVKEINENQEKMNRIASSLSPEQLKELNEVIEWCSSEKVSDDIYSNNPDQ